MVALPFAHATIQGGTFCFMGKLCAFEHPINLYIPIKKTTFVVHKFDKRCGAARTFGEGLRRNIVAHFACKVRGDKYCGGQTRAKNPTKSCAKALTIFATCSWPSLCEQSELQCWRRNRRLCGPAQISAARAPLPLKGPQTRLLPHNLHQLNISILNTLAARGIAEHSAKV